MRSLLFCWKISMRTFIVFFLFFNFFLFFFLQKIFISFSEESFLFYNFFLEKSYVKKHFLLIVKKEKKHNFLQLFILPILSLIVEYCKLETPENTDLCICQVTYPYWVKRHSEIAWTYRNSCETSIITEISDWNGIHYLNIFFNIYPNLT